MRYFIIAVIISFAGVALAQDMGIGSGINDLRNSNGGGPPAVVSVLLINTGSALLINTGVKMLIHN